MSKSKVTVHDLDTEEVTNLVTLLEESTRASQDVVKYFLEPGAGILNRALSKRHHIIFGRRGSGKSSLLRKAVSVLTIDRIPIGYVDLEQFKGHSYPDVLVSILIKTFEEFKQWLDTAALAPANKKKFWERLFGSIPKKAAFKKTPTVELSVKLGDLISELGVLLLEGDEVHKKLTQKHEVKIAVEAGGEVKVNSGPASAAGSAKASKENGAEHESESQYSHRKIEVLHRNIMKYKSMFAEISELAGGSSFLLLDDLYFIRKSDQAQVIDYFHRIAKGSNLWLKIGTIRHRSRYYSFGDPPIGMKLGDDADEIDLDVTLEKFNLTKKFLMAILENFATACGVGISDILTDGAKDRLILASGGVARDFLTIFRRAILVARERIAGGDIGRGIKVGAEDVNVSAGALDDNKREDFNRDTESSVDREAILSSYEKILSKFCQSKLLFS